MDGQRMKSLLLGNGINIQFGGVAYTSSFIIKRMKYKSLMSEYSELFDYTISAAELNQLFNGFVDEANQIIKKKYDKYVPKGDDNTISALRDFQKRYRVEVKEPSDIMLEDWLFIVHMFFLKNSDLEEARIAGITGFERLLLDAIYNEGDIQRIYLKMGKPIKKLINRYENVFTLNYDNNIELLTGRKVFHLHGDFSVLADTENPKMVNGYINNREGKTVVQKNWEHCYCNALLNYSGDLKMKRIKDNEQAIEVARKYISEINGDRTTLENIQKKNLVIYNILRTLLDNPDLEVASDYHFNNLRNISGELHIIGMSPNNDSHVFDTILNNKKLNKIVFYYKDSSQKEYIEKIFPKGLLSCKSVDLLWKSMGCDSKEMNYAYTIPDRFDELVAAGNALSGENITTQNLLHSLKNISPIEMRRLNQLVDEELQKGTSKKDSITFEEQSAQRASISYIALRNGILPTVLYVICVMKGKWYNTDE